MDALLNVEQFFISYVLGDLSAFMVTLGLLWLYYMFVASPRFKSIESKMEAFFTSSQDMFREMKEAFKSMAETLAELKENMVEYKIIKHTVFEQELIEVGRVIRMSADNVGRIIKNFYCNENKDKSREKLLSCITTDVEALRERFHSELVQTGRVSPRSILLWEETEAETFERFVLWIIKCADMIERINDCDSVFVSQLTDELSDKFFHEFMRVFKNKFAITKEGSK